MLDAVETDALAPEAVYTDDRGTITALPPFTSQGAMIIESEPGAVRGNHYHLDESHLMYVISGRMLYLEENADGTLSTTEVTAGGTVISPRGRAHCTVFPERTVMCVLNDVDRTGAKYEERVIRVQPLQERIDLSAYLPGK